MHSIVVFFIVGSFAYIATMIDNLFAFAAQLPRTPRSQFSPTTLAQSAGVVVLVGLAVVVGSALDVLPLRWVGVLALAPWSLAWLNWRRRHDESDSPTRRAAVTTFLITLGLGGDNLAVWIPLLRAAGPVHELVLGIAFSLCQILFIGVAWALATHPRVIGWGQRSGRHFIPWLYVGLGFVILFECHVL